MFIVRPGKRQILDTNTSCAKINITWQKSITCYIQCNIFFNFFYKTFIKIAKQWPPPKNKKSPQYTVFIMNRVKFCIFFTRKKVYYEQGLQVYDFFPSLYSFLVFKPLPFYQKLNILTFHSQFAIVLFMDDLIVVNMCFPIFFCIFIGRNKLNIFYTISIYWLLRY